MALTVVAFSFVGGLSPTDSQFRSHSTICPCGRRLLRTHAHKEFDIFAGSAWEAGAIIKIRPRESTRHDLGHRTAS